MSRLAETAQPNGAAANGEKPKRPAAHRRGRSTAHVSKKAAEATIETPAEPAMEATL
jgi:hypothetical protein